MIRPRTNTHIHTLTHTHTLTNTHTHSYMNKHSHTHTHMHKQSHTHTYTNTKLLRTIPHHNTQKHKNTDTHTHTPHSSCRAERTAGSHKGKLKLRLRIEFSSKIVFYIIVSLQRICYRCLCRISFYTSCLCTLLCVFYYPLYQTYSHCYCLPCCSS